LHITIPFKSNFNLKCKHYLVLAVLRNSICLFIYRVSVLPRGALVHIEIACRPSVCLSVFCLSVTLVDQDHIGWKSWKQIARLISPTHSLFVAQRPSTYSQGNMGKFGGD